MSRNKSADIRQIRKRIIEGEANLEDSKRLLELVDHYRRQTHAVAGRVQSENHRLRRQIADFEFTLRMARDPMGHGLHLSQCELFQALVQPERLRELREKVAAAYMDTLKWEVQWVKRVREERRRLEDADR